MVATMKPAMFIFLLFLIETAIMISSFGNENPQVVCHESERQALLSFKKDLEDPSNRLSSWAAEDDCCKWAGIVCNNVTGHVQELNLANPPYEAFERFRLRGKVSPSLLNLKHLSLMDLSYNNFGGTQIPTFIGSLRSLRYLNLGGAGFEGMIPHQLGNLTNLLSLILANNYLNGPIQCASLNMPSLRNLDLSSNYLNCSIPNCLFGFPSLETLDLSYTNLQGELSNDIENLTSLLYLGLSDNYLRPGIPRSMRNLCNLMEIDLKRNEFGGEISKAFENLSGCVSHSLVSLRLGSNYFSSHMGDHFERFEKLEILELAHNSISGPIPDAIGRLSSLVSLDISNNEFNGTLPESIGGLSNLYELLVDDNHLEGVVSEVQFVNLTNLKIFSASGNSLISTVKPRWIPPFQLKSLFLGSWQLGPQIPMWIKSQEIIDRVDFSSTGISGTIPSWFWNLSSNFHYLDLSHNQIYGQIPKIHSFHADGLLIYLSSNQFSSPLPHLSSNVGELDLSNNSFSEEISHFLCRNKGKPNYLRILHLGKNHLFGKIPDCWKNWPALEFIDLGYNNLTGKIPSSMGHLLYLDSLRLRNNSLSGKLPHFLHKYTRLVTLDIAMNKFTGSIPSWMGTNLLNLKYLFLRSNKFRGQIPDELCQLTSLQIMDAADNNLFGNIPKCFNNFTAMVEQQTLNEWTSYSRDIFVSFLETANVVMKGNEYEYDTILPLVTSLDLSSNNLSGEIPEELTSLLGLLSLNLSKNNLTGNIPYKIGDMKQLLSLDLSTNHLSGKIPPSISGLSFLAHLNLSYNMLSGQIPTGTQLQSFDASSFAGNELCGPPLIKNCSSSGITPPTDHQRTEEEERDWLYLFIALGFVVGFGGVWLPLYFSKSWRHTYFSFIDRMWIKIWVIFHRRWF